MKFPVLTIVIAFVAWLTVKLAQGKKETQAVMDEFWKKESAANAVRRKSLDDLDYIGFPFEILPKDDFFVYQGQEVPPSLKMLRSLSDKKIVNLNNISNTDLKLQYGTSNITILTEYDENFLTLCREGFLLAEYLYDTDNMDSAMEISRAVIGCGSDVSGQYTLLWKIYDEKGLDDGKKELFEIVEKMESSRKNAILRALTELEENKKEKTDTEADGTWHIHTEQDNDALSQ